MKWIYSSSIILSILFTACETAPKIEKPTNSKSGMWRMEMELAEGKILPFEFSLTQTNEDWEMVIFNHEEEIEVDELEWKDDTLIIQLPIFESEFILKKESDTSFSGVWVNYYKSENYKIPVVAKFEKTTRFIDLDEEYNPELGGKYAVTFSPNTENEGNAIGLFDQSGNTISGTFATERGDYRHLAGNVSGNKVLLSTFDGSHAFLFEAELSDSGLVGTFYSGTHWKEAWTAVKDDSVTLRNPNELTFIKEGYDGLAFSFPDANGDSVSLTDERFKGKAVIVQIMGSWCPNCLDETKYLSSLYEKYNDQGLEVIALAFERTRTPEKAMNNLERLKTKTGANYTFLLGGATREDKAAEKLPMLNHIMSYPTAIFIDKKGVVKRIHTGFYGPSTGKYYTDFVEETEALVKTILNDE